MFMATHPAVHEPQSTTPIVINAASVDAHVPADLYFHRPQADYGGCRAE
jgi:hypothetical protein